jgi:very-short-patch-repair endonuclease
MRGQSRTPLVAELAAAQHGVVSRGQLLDLGFSSDAIDRLLRKGWLHRVFRGVYAVGHTMLPPNGRASAAVLTCGSDASLSYRSAGELWGLLRTSRYVIDVTVPRRIRGQRGLAAHFGDPDRAVSDGIPVTTVPQTLLDIAEVLTPRRLERAWDQAERLELFDLIALEDLLARSNGRRGIKPLRALIAEARMPEPTRSELEDMLADICRAADLPIPAFNVSVAGEDVDAYWASHNLVVELDGWAHHRTRADRERDLLKEERIKLAGYRFHRFSYRRLAKRPDEVAHVLSKYLAAVPILL